MNTEVVRVALESFSPRVGFFDWLIGVGTLLIALVTLIILLRSNRLVKHANLIMKRSNEIAEQNAVIANLSYKRNEEEKQTRQRHVMERLVNAGTQIDRWTSILLLAKEQIDEWAIEIMDGRRSLIFEEIDREIGICVNEGSLTGTLLQDSQEARAKLRSLMDIFNSATLIARIGNAPPTMIEWDRPEFIKLLKEAQTSSKKLLYELR